MNKREGEKNKDTFLTIYIAGDIRNRFLKAIARRYLLMYTISIRIR